jgi:DNA-binding MarR family transcriptional regulator
MDDIKPLQSSSVEDETVTLVDHYLHRMIFGLHLDNPGIWSEELDGELPIDIHTIMLVAERPDIILKEVREELDVPHSTLTSIIDRLEKRGMLQRVISPRDRRSFGLELTLKGRRLHEEHSRVDRLVASRLLETLDGVERDLFVKLLTKIGERLR